MGKGNCRVSLRPFGTTQPEDLDSFLDSSHSQGRELIRQVIGSKQWTSGLVLSMSCDLISPANTPHVSPIVLEQPVLTGTVSGSSV